jgi:hypothetical protein
MGFLWSYGLRAELLWSRYLLGGGGGIIHKTTGNTRICCGKNMEKPLKK